MLRETLEAEGVDPGSIEVVDEEPAAVEAALALARPHDLVLIFGDDVNRTWKQIIYFKPGGLADDAARSGDRAGAPVPRPPPEPSKFDADRLIRDERGVRLAREPED